MMLNLKYNNFCKGVINMDTMKTHYCGEVLTVIFAAKMFDGMEI